ncbi:MAG: gamma-glutamyltransferase [Gammaproteobacteria bacterium]|jgi:gamma-glutamyltranspeptidase/glutathione hydrolase
MTIRFARLVFATLLLSVQFGCAARAPAPGQAAIASADPLATAAGMEILEQGGNAFDAAVAVAAALGVVEPAASGFGGGGFFLLYIADKDEYRFIDAREKAPLKATRDMYLDEDGRPLARASTDGALAAGIPGEPAGMVYLSENFGDLPLKAALAPAIRYAEEGFVMSRRAQLGLKFRKSSLLGDNAFSEVFYPNGTIPEVGDVIRQPDLAATIRRFAAAGFDGYYAGETADLLVSGVQQAGGIWTHNDLQAYSVTEREPLIASYADMRVVTAPPPSSGGIALAQMFNILSGYELAAMSIAQRDHLLVEAMRRAYRDRALYLGDADFVTIPVAMLISPEYAAGQRVSIRADRATDSNHLAGIEPDGSEGAQTTHFSIIDAAGNRVAATITVNTWYGSGFMPPGTGVILNNEMDDFSIKPGVPNEFELIGDEANAVAPGKRPLSSMTPSFLESDRGIAIVGTPGGSRIITMVLLAALEWQQGASAADMVAMKRFHHQYLPDVINYEPGAFSDEEIARLQSLGHSLSLSRRPFGNMNVVTWDYADNKVESATDPRGEGEGRVY